MLPASEDTISDLMKQHDQFVGTLQARLAKLQVLFSSSQLLIKVFKVEFQFVYVED